MAEFRGAKRPVADQTNDWCFNCYSCGALVRANGSVFPPETEQHHVEVQPGLVIPKLVCSSACGSRVERRVEKPHAETERRYGHLLAQPKR